ncbi:sensor histidine kinase [Paenibacillus spongiae]|uniref:histidine kinase n=1 Tax=Paenibacillus spongiae TaxID=2909671 RepID=A0ABY5S4D7_9BACL|nr:HAMP domain-containing sensor histidine kinase [Paenibacillus spongiae]UVI27603.1 HAMP domain-containing histidine kinase [Paenibacillus spongiae]
MERITGAGMGFARMWRNPSIRRLAAALAVLLFMAIVFIALYSHYSTERLKKEWLDKEAAMIGSLADEQPEWVESWLRQVVESDEPSPESVAEGRKIMERYGVTSRLEANWFPVLGEYRSRTLWILVIGAIGFAVLAAIWLFRYARRQLVEIRSLAISLEDTVKHNQPASYRIYDEGELGLLANGVQELTLRLGETIEQLHKEKAFLKNTVADISHQLKTPLASLMIYTDLMQSDQIDADHAQEFLQTCRSELDRMEWLILALLKLARLEADALDMSFKEAPVADTVKRAVESIVPLAEDKQVTMHIEESDTSLIILHDAHWLTEALVNVLKNAVEHSPASGIVSIGWEETPVFIRIRIKDQGRGIDPQHLPHIFKKFYRSSSEGSGVGLGLPLAKSIVEKHGGILSASAHPAGGTLFQVTLPLHPFPSAAAKLTEL